MVERITKSGTDYRPDLDGLRGIAVLAVVAYHLDVPFVTGGFIGVDIFFVLSGFLITRLIAAELRAGDFSIARFYERRIRRIVPALVFVCACTTAAALRILMPGELKLFASSLFATVGSISNIWFYWHSGYFDPGSGTQPLLHTWSLGIEEQFYVIFPLLLMALFRWGTRFIGAAVWLLFAVSLAVSIALLSENPQAAFYLLHARAWELLAGAIVALRLVPRPASKLQSDVAAGVGLVAIGVAIFGYTSKTPFPGAAALLPCIGTAMAIWAGEFGGGIATRALTVRPLIWTGLISYSLYLWHWPLIVFTKLVTSTHLDARERIEIAVAAVVLASATWYFVEQPFRRRGSSGFGRRAIFQGGALGLGALAVVAIAMRESDGIPSRFPGAILQIAAAQDDSSPLRAKCHFQRDDERTYDDTCVLGDDVAPSIVVYGDSHGAELAAQLGEIAKSRHASVRQITASGCPPALGFTFPTDDHCEHYNAAVIDRLKAIPPATIVLATYSITWNREFPDQFWPAMERTIETLRAAGHRVIVVGPVPDMPESAGIPATIARWTAWGNDPNDFSFASGEADGVNARLNAIATAHGAMFAPISPQLCSNARCKPYVDGSVLYFDNNHLSMTGARMIASQVLAPLIWPEPDITGLNAGRAPY